MHSENLVILKVERSRQRRLLPHFTRFASVVILCTAFGACEDNGDGLPQFDVRPAPDAVAGDGGAGDGPRGNDGGDGGSADSLDGSRPGDAAAGETAEAGGGVDVVSADTASTDVALADGSPSGDAVITGDVSLADAADAGAGDAGAAD